jgi:uncharacterized protein involved in exopolysaccharide biosynthesis
MQTSIPAEIGAPALLKGWDYLAILGRQYRIILASIVFFIAVALLVRVLTPPKFESRVVTVPTPVESDGRPAARDALTSLGLFASSGTANPKEVAIATLNARSFIVEFIRREKLLPILFADEWDGAEKRWVRSTPTDEEAFDKLHDALAVDSSATDGLVIVRVRWSDSKTAASLANRLVQSLNKQFQMKAVAESDRTITYLYEAYQKVQVGEIQVDIANLIQDQIRQRIMALSRDEYTLTVIDPAQTTKKKINPGLAILLPIGFFIGLLCGIPGAFLLHTLNPRWGGLLARLLPPRP